MGFFKKFFSLGSKNKKKTNVLHDNYAPRVQVDSNGRLEVPKPKEKDNGEAAASRLLRSSSARFAVVSEMDYTSLPPIPHPINTVTSTRLESQSKPLPPKASFTVTIHGRTQHSRTEFPNANPPLRTPPSSKDDDEYDDSDGHVRQRQRYVSDPRKVPFTPRDKNRLSRLRQDPSVISLLQMYDDHGRLDERAFSNTPRNSRFISADREKTDVSPLRKRRNSTLRDLLIGTGDVADTDASVAADISWAERCLANNSSTSTLSTTSSLGLETPTNNLFENDPLHDAPYGNTILSHELSIETSTVYPVISSMEVELSQGLDSVDISSPEIEDKSLHFVTRTPSKRASQVFRFLSEKRKKPEDKFSDINGGQTRSIAPLFKNVVRDFEEPRDHPIGSDSFVMDQLYPVLDIPAAALPRDRLAALELPLPIPPSPAVFRPLRPPPVRTKSRSTSAADTLKGAPKRRTAALSTGPQVLTNAAPKNIAPPTRGPRGPRPPITSSAKAVVTSITQESVNNYNHSRSVIDRDAGEPHPARSQINTFVSNSDRLTPAPRRLSTSKASESSHQHMYTISNKDTRGMAHDKENVGLTYVRKHSTGPASFQSASSEVKPLNPLAPSRNASWNLPLQYVKREEVPSPASSSELSPTGKMMMRDLRAQRQRARDAQAQGRKRKKIYHAAPVAPAIA